uniref:Uncharacterized protein n=1 Tax=Saccharolobus solfataricus (strain 98/2) TaxID=555311 RepID=D0KST7_SACS9
MFHDNFIVFLYINLFLKGLILYLSNEIIWWNITALDQSLLKYNITIISNEILNEKR